MRTLFFCLFFFLLLKSTNAFSQAGELDTTFGTNGIGAFVFPGATDRVAYSEAIQPDGKIIIAGYITPHDSSPVFALARYNTNGSLDGNFGNNGQVSLKKTILYDVEGGYVAIQPDGKILLAGESRAYNYTPAFALVRFNTNGSLDTTFSRSGIVVTNFNNLGSPDIGGPIAVQTDGKIIQIGATAIFNSQGDWTGIDDWEIARYNSNGSIDSSFGIDGVVQTMFPNPVSGPSSIVLQSDGKMVVGGTSSQPGSPPSCFALARYNSNGTLDSSFGTNGKATLYFGSGTSGQNYDEDECHAIALQSDGKIIMAGSSELGSDTVNVLRFARFKSSGTLDSSFGIDGKVAIGFNSAVIYSICVQPNNKIILAGGGLFRYNENGTTDSSFGKNGIVITATDTTGIYIYSSTLQADGKIVVAGNIDSGLGVARYLTGLNTGVINFSSPQNPLLIYPNPINKQATLQYSLTQNESISLTLTDMLGRQVQTFFTSQTRTQGEHKEELQLSNTLAAGNYVLSISNGHSSQGVKVTVVR